MNPFRALLRSTIGKKIVMAVSGMILFGFVLAHMLGNLQVFLGPTRLDEYGAALRRIPELLWAARLTLLVAVIAHIWSAYALTMLNRAARPVGYRAQSWLESSAASRTMRWTGVLLLAFIVYHLLHFTFGSVHPDFIPGAVNHNFVTGFRDPLVSAFYLAAMLSLGFHLYHGAWSMLQTLGLNHPRYNPLRHAFASFVTALIVIGNVSMPVAVLAGLLDEAPPSAEYVTQAAR